MKLRHFTFVILISTLLLNCKRDMVSNSSYFNDQVEFDIEGSDPEALWVADDAIAASGGDQAWQDTKFIKWNMFGERWLVWDKENGKIRIENISDDRKFILDLKANTIQVYFQGKEWTNKDTLTKYLPIGYKIWLHDAQWLALPFKLKDPGAHLRYVREDSTFTGISSDVIGINYDSLNPLHPAKYEIWVGKNSSLVAQWAMYNSSEDIIPSLLTTWDGYIKYGDIFISSDRGDGRQITGIKVYESLPPEVFKNFDPIDLDRL